MAEEEDGKRARGPSGRPGTGAAGRPGAGVLPPPLRGGLGLVAVLAALVAGGLGVRYAGTGEPTRADAWSGAVVGAGGPFPHRAALVVDFLGEPAGAAVLVLVVVAGCLLLRRPGAAALAVGGPGAAVVTATLLKPLVGRTIHGGSLSYPSGHTAFLTAFALVVAVLVAGRFGLGRAAGLSLVLGAGLVAGAVMGWAQVLLDAHYPTDTLGGWCTALAVVPAAAWLIDRTAGRVTGRVTGRPAA